MKIETPIGEMWNHVKKRIRTWKQKKQVIYIILYTVNNAVKTIPHLVLAKIRFKTLLVRNQVSSVVVVSASGYDYKLDHFV